MDILKILKERRSAKSFKPGDIKKDTLDRILDAGRLAPSAKNRQPWRFIAVTDSKVKDSLLDSCYGDERVGQAGAIIAICTTNTDYKMPNGQHAYPIDLSFAVSYMMLQTHHEGLASTVLTTYDEESIKQEFSVPFKMRVVMLLLVGEGENSTGVANRLPANRVISYNHW